MSSRFDRRRDQGQGAGAGGPRPGRPSGGRPSAGRPSAGRPGARPGGSRAFTPRGEWRPEGGGGERSSRPERPAKRSFDGPRPQGGYRERSEGYRADGPRPERGERRFERRPSGSSGAQGEGRSFRQGRPQGRPQGGRSAFKPRFGGPGGGSGPAGGERRFDRDRAPMRDRPPLRDRDRDRPVAVDLPSGEAERFNAGPADDLIWGRHAAQAALESDRPIHRIWCTSEMRFQPRFMQLLREAKSAGVLVEEVTWARLGQLTDGAVHQGIVMQAAAADTLDLGSLIDGCRDLGEPPLLMALDGITDPHNLGAIVRSAEALGAHGLVLPQRRSAGLTGSVAKVAAGALEHLPVARVVNLNRSLEELKQEGYRVVGLAGEGDVTLGEADLDGPLVIVTGSEGSGLSMLTRKHCDQLVRIPLRGTTPSLNASVATAMLLYEVARRGWMKQITGAAPAPRIVRPQLPAPPAIVPAQEPAQDSAQEPVAEAADLEAELDFADQADEAPEELFSPEEAAAAEQLVAEVVADLAAQPAAEQASAAEPEPKPESAPVEFNLGFTAQPASGFSGDIQL